MFCLTDFAQGLSYKGTQYRQVSEVIFRCQFLFVCLFVFFFFVFFFGFAVGVSNLKQQVL